MTAWGPIGREVFDRTYSRTKSDGTKETFDEVVERMVDGNVALAPENVDPGERERLIELISEHKLVPAGRHWWVSGVPGRQFLFNCHRAGWTDQLSDHVGFLFDELMKGGGVGANYSSDYLARLHRVRRKVEVTWTAGAHPDLEELRAVPLQRAMDGDFEYAFVSVPDTREGWVFALEQMCRYAQLEGPDLYIEFDVSGVRARGSVIQGFGGTASGPGPLIKMLVDVATVLNRAVGKKLDPIQAMEIDHAIASCVIAGNVRRSARMSMIHWRDPFVFEVIDAKQHGDHWTTNISVEVDDEFWKLCTTDEWAADVLQAIAEGMHRNGEPGIFNSSNAAVGEQRDVRCTNPCGEIALEEWEQCNLGHVNLARITSDDEFVESACLMARWLMRATMAKGSSWRQWEVVQRNRRIGVGILGFQEWLWREFRLKYAWGNHFTPREAFTEVYYKVQRECDAYALELGIAVPIKLTTVAPTGTVAKISGVTEGIHPVYSRYFIRRVRYGDSDPGLLAAKELGLKIEPDLNSANTWVVEYPCRDSALDQVPPDALEQADEITPRAMLSVQKMVQLGWADNAVSFTVNFDPELYNVTYIRETLKEYGRVLKGTTFMPDGSYEQAPLERITQEEYEQAAVQFDGSSADDCANGACPVR